MRLVVSVVVLLGLAAVGGACDSRRAEDLAPPPAPPFSPEPGILPDTAPQAYYLLRHDTFFDPQWPEYFQRFDLFICDSSFDSDRVADVRAAVPGATLLAAMNAQMVPLHIWNGAYYDSLEARFDTTLGIRDLNTGNMIRLLRDHVEFVMQREQADILSDFHAEFTMSAGYDGIYIDQCRNDFPPWKKYKLSTISDNFDFDADGEPDTIEEMDEIHGRWKPYFLKRLRSLVGRDVLLVGNSGGKLVDASLNGITLENVGPRFSLGEATWNVENARAVATQPWVGVLWIKEYASYGSSNLLAGRLGTVYVGEIGEAFLDDEEN